MTSVTRSGAVALLELLARAAPARVVPADLVRRARLHRDRREAERRRDARGGADRRRALLRFVLVTDAAVALRLLLELLLRLLGGQLGVEQMEDDLAADGAGQLDEHALALGGVLDERVLLRHRAEADALAQVVHVLEVLAPTDVDDLEDDEPLELAHELGAELLLLRRVLVARVGPELLDERLARDLAEVLAQLLRGDLRLVQRGHRVRQRLEVPFLRVLLGRERVDGVLDHLVDPEVHLLRHVLALEHLPPLLVDAAAVPVEDVVVLEDVLAHDEVLLFDLLLRALDLPAEDLRLHRLVLRDLEALHDPLDAVAGEQAHEIVLAGEVEARLAGVALAAGAAAKLVVDAPRLVPLGREHVQAAELRHALAELDVDAATRHVRRDRHRAALAGVLDDLRLARVLLRVQNAVPDALPRQQLREVLRRLDRDRADEDRLPLLRALLDVARDGEELPVLRLEDEVLLVLTRDGDVGRDLDDAEVVDLDELLLLRLRGTGHAGELLVQAEVVLQRDRRHRQVLFLDGDVLLRLDRLVQALAPAAAFHDAAGELVDDLDLAVLDDVVDVVLVERLRLQRLVQMVDELRVLRRVQVVDAERALDLGDTLLGGGDRLVLLVELVVGADLLGVALRVARFRAVAVERGRDAREVVVDLRGGLRLAGDDQRRARLVDEDRVDLVHDRVRMAALHDAVERDGHVVAEIVEAELGVRPVGDVGAVGLAPRLERHHVLDVGGAHAERAEDRLRPLLIALGEVVVRRHEMDAAARERVQVHRLGGDERLALAGLHLGDVALVEDDAAHQLDVEEADAERALERLPHGGEGLEDEVVEGLAVLEPLAELHRLGGELLVGQRLELGLERADVGRLLGEPLETPAFTGAEDLFERAELLGHTRTGYRPPSASLGMPTGRGLQAGRPLKPARLDLPEIAVETLRADDVGAARQLGNGAEDARTVDAKLAPGKLDLVSGGRVLQLHHVDAFRLNSPEVVVLPRRPRAIRRRHLLLDRVGERLQRAVGPFLDDQRPVRKRDEDRPVPVDVRRDRRDGRVPLARALHPVNADLAPWGLSRLALDEAALPCEPLVQRLVAAKEAQVSRWCLSILRFVFLRLRSSFTCRSSFPDSSSIDTFMSRVDSRARSVCPFNQTVASATWLAAMDGFFSTASSTSTRASLLTCLSSLPSFRSA